MPRVVDRSIVAGGVRIRIRIRMLTRRILWRRSSVAQLWRSFLLNPMSETAAVTGRVTLCMYESAPRWHHQAITWV